MSPCVFLPESSGQVCETDDTWNKGSEISTSNLHSHQVCFGEAVIHDQMHMEPSHEH